MLPRRLRSTSRRPHTYHAHRRSSFVPADLNEQVELRARLRTFDGAYARTALANLGYSVLVLKLFDRRFYRIGLVYVVLALCLLLVQWQRRRHARHDFADDWKETMPPAQEDDEGENYRREQGQAERVWGRPFVTAGSVVVLVTLLVGSVEIALFALICDL